MNKAEQAKARALRKCRIGDWQGEQSFVKGMAWLAEHSPQTNLSAQQKWYLDSILWRYRKQLAGRTEGFELPTTAPQQESYLPQRRKRQVQESLI